jgi:hypothetical protein
MPTDIGSLLATAGLAGQISPALQASQQRMAATRKRQQQVMLEALQAIGSGRGLAAMLSGGGVPSGGGGAGGSLPSAGRGGITVGQVSGLSPAEAYIIQHESGGRPTAKNPTSTAFGIWQGLQGTRNDYARRLGFSPNTTDVAQQLAMFRAYVRDRYKTAENAQRFWQTHHWY